MTWTRWMEILEPENFLFIGHVPWTTFANTGMFLFQSLWQHAKPWYSAHAITSNIICNFQKVENGEIVIAMRQANLKALLSINLRCHALADACLPRTAVNMIAEEFCQDRAFVWFRLTRSQRQIKLLSSWISSYPVQAFQRSLQHSVRLKSSDNILWPWPVEAWTSSLSI